MIPLLATSDMEAAVALLAKQCPRVIVRARYECQPAIRLRVKALDVTLHYCRWSPPNLSVPDDEWRQHGGVLINFTANEPEVAHDVKLICECPWSLKQLSVLTTYTSLATVVYRPPTWKSHLERMEMRWPSEQACREFYSAPDQLKPQGWKSSFMRRAVFGMGFTSANVRFQLIPRVEPEDRSLLALYRHICELPAVDGIHSSTRAELWKSVPGWRLQLNALVRCGSVERKADAISYANAPKPDFTGIEKRRQDNFKTFTAMREAVDAAPELTVKSLRALCRVRRAQARPSAVPARRATAARADDKAG